MPKWIDSKISMEQPSPTRKFPPTWRIVVAFFTVPGLAALLMAVVMPAYDGLDGFFERVWRSAMFYAIFGAYPPAVAFGVPSYFVLRRFLNAKLINCALTGAVIAALPWLVLSTFSLPDSASIGGQATVIDGSLTAYGWLSNLKSVGQIALFGGVAGIMFWLISAAGSDAQSGH